MPATSYVEKVRESVLERERSEGEREIDRET